jgi:hypothetical protein
LTISAILAAIAVAVNRRVRIVDPVKGIDFGQGAEGEPCRAVAMRGAIVAAPVEADMQAWKKGAGFAEGPRSAPGERQGVRGCKSLTV